MDESGGHIKGGAFAGSVRTQKARHFPGANIQRQVVDSSYPAVGFAKVIQTKSYVIGTQYKRSFLLRRFRQEHGNSTFFIIYQVNVGYAIIIKFPDKHLPLFLSFKLQFGFFLVKTIGK